MIDERAYWVWLQQAFGAGSPKPMRLHRRTPGGVKTFCDGGAKLWNSSRSLTDREATALREFTLQQAESRLEYALKLGWQVITPIDPSYPPLLLEIDAPPAVLYVKGKLPDWNSCLPISVAGSRKATKESVDFARKLGYELAAGGATVISGGAAGIDAAAMTGALTLPGAGVVSVLPVSLDSNYLMANAGLRKSICERGTGERIFRAKCARTRHVPHSQSTDYRHEPRRGAGAGGEEERHDAVCGSCSRPEPRRVCL